MAGWSAASALAAAPQHAQQPCRLPIGRFHLAPRGMEDGFNTCADASVKILVASSTRPLSTTDSAGRRPVNAVGTHPAARTQPRMLPRADAVQWMVTYTISAQDAADSRADPPARAARKGCRGGTNSAVAE